MYFTHPASDLAAHLPHSAAWWYRSWCTRPSPWLQPESYSWLTPTWRQQKCWRSPPDKWQSQTQRRSPHRSVRKTEEPQWALWRNVAGRGVPATWENPLMTKENKAGVVLTQQTTAQFILFTAVNTFSCLYLFSCYSNRKTIVLKSS